MASALDSKQFCFHTVQKQCSFFTSPDVRPNSRFSPHIRYQGSPTPVLKAHKRHVFRISFAVHSYDQRCHSGILIAAACQTQRDRYPGRCNVTDRCRSRCKVAQCEEVIAVQKPAGLVDSSWKMPSDLQ
ncbi:unnamed protein product [Ranitomeya imitator]|uniref:Uncharacterized protein n=1 Tax=Ranitomeya imitator TaxID=111125 RepID=A0ABN9MPW4_9NEOB|nr:unnamed protein product [Ranitomeya imitator]